MKANKLLKTLAASAMSLALLAGVTAMPAMAAQEGGVVTNGTSFTAKSILQIPEDVAVPDVTLDFQVEPGVAGTYDGMVTYAGPAGGVTVSDADYNVKVPGVASGGYYQESVDVTIGTSNAPFDHAGVYVYTVKIADDGKDIIREDTAHTLYVYVRETAAGGDFEVYGMVLTSNGTTKTETFVSKYLFDENGPNPGGHTANITVSKTVNGTFGNKDQEFSFPVTVPANLYYEKSDGTNGLTNGTPFELSHGEHVTIYGVMEGASYTISEDDYSGEKYQTTVAVTGGTQPEEGTTVTGTIVAGTNVRADYTNTRDASTVTPTGIILNIAPYALMVVIAVAGVAVFMRKRVEE